MGCVWVRSSALPPQGSPWGAWQEDFSLWPHTPGPGVAPGQVSSQGTGRIEGLKVHVHLHLTCVLPIEISSELNHMTRCLCQFRILPC